MNAPAVKDAENGDPINLPISKPYRSKFEMLVERTKTAKQEDSGAFQQHPLVKSLEKNGPLTPSFNLKHIEKSAKISRNFKK